MDAMGRMAARNGYRIGIMSIRTKVIPYCIDDEGISNDGEVCDDRYIENLRSHVNLEKRIEKLEKDFADFVKIVSEGNYG